MRDTSWTEVREPVYDRNSRAAGRAALPVVSCVLLASRVLHNYTARALYNDDTRARTVDCRAARTDPTTINVSCNYNAAAPSPSPARPGLYSYDTRAEPGADSTTQVCISSTCAQIAEARRIKVRLVARAFGGAALWHASLVPLSPLLLLVERETLSRALPSRWGSGAHKPTSTLASALELSALAASASSAVSTIASSSMAYRLTR